MVDTFITKNTIGNSVIIRRPTRVAVSVSSALATANRSVSRGSAVKARITRRPEICSRSTRLMVSMRVCWVLNSGIIWLTIEPIRTPMITTATAIVQLSPGSSRSAMMMPPTIMMGAATIMNAVIITSC